MDPVAHLNSALAGRYEVEREIGAGGMATVYLARDVKHDRRVALKLLNAELGAVLGVERFLSEIKVTANLQHPNLLPLFDSGEADGLLFYVMPFVEGETLRSRLTREKQLPVDEAVRITVAIAGALDYAHTRGVIHRDLKPENILLQHGQPMVADFGIALAVANAGGQRVTQTGLSLGTPQYMSPEQATGDRVIDGRSDIYSLGAVLYEMLSGDPPHTASTSQAIVAKLLTETPRSVRASRPSVPENVDAAIEHSLEKLPADRFVTAREFSEALQGRSTTFATSAAKRTGVARARRRDPLFIGAVVVALAAIAGAVFFASRGRVIRPPSPVHFAVVPPPNVRVVDGSTWSVTLTPDGDKVVFTGQGNEGPSRLYVRELDQLSARPIPGTERATQPVFSPDGKWIAFQADGKLKKLSLDGSGLTTISDLHSQNGMAWSAGDVMVLGADGARHGLARVPAGGGTPVELTHVDASKKELEHLWPVVLDDGKTVVFTVYYGSLKTARIAVASLDDGKVTVLDAQGIAPLGVVANHLLYVRMDGVVLAAPFDVSHRRVTGAAIPALDQVSVCGGCNGDAKVRVAKDGSLVYMTGSIAARLVWVSPDGKEAPVLDEVRSFANPRISPDNKKIAVGIVGSQSSDVWVYDIASATLTRVTTGGNSVGEWTADGKHLVFFSDRDGGSGGFYSQAIDGSAQPEKLLDAKFLYTDALMSPDGRSLMYMTYSNNNVDVIIAPLAGDKTPRPFAATAANERAPRFSPDGLRIAYESNESGQSEVYVRPVSGEGGRVQISASGGMEPVWAKDGSRLYYRSSGQMIAADLTTSPAVAVTKRATLFGGPYYQDGTVAAYDVSGGPNPRLLMLKANDSDLQVVVITNWVEELKRRIAKP
ncbi:MAG TPA: protein kinase [Gemmatimonadaceae bacterium]|nr:protein kinase [Gemmatimonadaceae bacterium]